MQDTTYSLGGMSQYDNTFAGSQIQEDSRLGNRSNSNFFISTFNATGNTFTDSRLISIQVFGN